MDLRMVNIRYILVPIVKVLPSKLLPVVQKEKNIENA